MPLPSSCAPLFPYTTLFRSRLHTVIAQHDTVECEIAVHAAELMSQPHSFGHCLQHVQLLGELQLKTPMAQCSAGDIFHGQVITPRVPALFVYVGDIWMFEHAES